MCNSRLRIIAVLLLMEMILQGVPTYGKQVRRWSKVPCNKGGSRVDTVKADTSKAYMVTMDVPGINDLEFKLKKKAFQIWVRSVYIEPEEYLQNVGRKWLINERSYGQFWRRFHFPQSDARMDRMEIFLEDGVLHITVPRQTLRPPFQSLLRKPTSPIVPECRHILFHMVQCLPFVQGHFSVPTTHCCQNFQRAYHDTPKCLCLFLNGTVAPALTPTNTVLAAQLPGLCHIQANISTCFPSSGGSGQA